MVESADSSVNDVALERGSRVLACLPAGMARNIGVEFYLPPELVDAIDEKYENRSEAARRLFANDLEVEIDA